MKWICEVMFIIIFFFSVILPQLATVAAYALHMSNQTRKLDLAVALVEAFSSAVYCALSKQTISTALLPGLRYRFGPWVKSLEAQHIFMYCSSNT
jgi:predicted neutral ceramidase superfamily lipid hydrolase